MTPTLLAQTRDKTGEGIVWVPEEQAVYWADINRFLIHRFDLATSLVRDWSFPEPVTALALTTRPGTLIVALASKLIYWQPASDTRRDHGFRLPDAPDFRLNDGRPDPLGNFWTGSMKERIGPDGKGSGVTEWKGALYRVPPSGPARIRKAGIGISNTVCWSPDHTRFYFGDSERKEIYAFDYDLATGDISNEQVFFRHLQDGVPDGSAVDEAGHLWNCRYGGGCLLRVSPKGALEQRIPMPVANPTTCIFGGPDRRTLFITSAANGDEGNPLAGSLFSLRAEVPGPEPFRFRMPG